MKYVLFHEATEARRLGLVEEVYADPDALFAGARALSRRIAGNPPSLCERTIT